MTSLVNTLPFELAQGAAVSSLACYGLNRLYPTPDPTFMIMIGVAHACECFIGNRLQSSATDFLTGRYGENNPEQAAYKFHYLSSALHYVTLILLPLFYRSLGQALGYQIPGVIFTYGYLLLATSASWISLALIQGILGSPPPPIDIPDDS